MKETYLRRISGPILDRFDLHIEAPPVKSADLQQSPDGERSVEARARIERARNIQRKRFASVPGVYCNAQVGGPALHDLCRITPAGLKFLSDWIDKKQLSARSHDRILKVARTIADLRGCADVGEGDVQEAAQMRCLDEPLKGRPRRPFDFRAIARQLALHKPPGNPPGEHPTEGT
jgi:magnesium chelatase family protein